MRKAALASALTLLLSLSTIPALLAGAFAGLFPRYGIYPLRRRFHFPRGQPTHRPYLWIADPNGYEITQMFNNSCDPSLGQGYYFAGHYFCGHTGVDLTNFDAGGPIHATAAGIVVYAGYNSSYGEMIRIKHLLPNGAVIYSQYEHMMYGSILVGYGQIVVMGQTIGAVGATGFVTGAHLHFEIKSVDDPGVGYTFGNTALIMGYYEPISFVASHSLQLLPTATPPATSTPSSQVLALNATSTATPVATGGTTVTTGSSASSTGEHEAVLADFYKRYHSYVTVAADHLNVRSGSDFSFTPLNSVQKGAKLGFLGMTGNGWVHVALPSNVYGYVARQWVKGKVLPKLPPIEASIVLKPPFSYVMDTRYPARSGPHMHDAAIEVLKRGERLTYLGTLGSWDKVILPSGREGWVLNWYLHDPQQRIDLSPPAPAAPKPVTITCPCVVTTVDSLRLRAGPALSAPVIEGLPIGAKLALHGHHTSWVAVTAPDGHDG